MSDSENQTSNQMESEREKAEEEGWKLHYDTSKHITTLSAGSILILIAFLEKVFVQPFAKGLIVAALILFVFSIVMLVMAMVYIASLIRNRKHVGTFKTQHWGASIDGVLPKRICRIFGWDLTSCSVRP